MSIFQPLDELLAWQPPHIDEIVSGGLLSYSGKLVIAGAEGSLKTMLSIYAAFCISSGTQLFGFKTRPVNVGLLQAELPHAVLHKRVKKLAASGMPHGNIYFATQFSLKLDKPSGISAVAADVKRLGLNLLIIDPLYMLTTSLVDEQSVRAFVDNINLLSWSCNCAVWIAHHTRKQKVFDGEIRDMGTDELYGLSLLIKDYPDTIIRVKRNEDIVELTFPKVRNAERLIKPVRLRFNEDKLQFSLI